MPSPFPGMNPYLEQDDAWHDFHERFAPAAAELLQAQAGSKYIVKIDERVYIHELPEGERAQVLLPAVDFERHSFVEIRDRRNRELVTLIELLSPSNKSAGPDREQYLAKRGQLLASTAHFVEIDLLRGGPRMPIKGLPDCDYYVLVSRAEHRPRAGLWPLRLSEPLPGIPVPLRSPDGDIKLNLQNILHRIYDAAAYENYIYEGLPNPPLSAEQMAWAKGFFPPIPQP